MSGRLEKLLQSGFKQAEKRFEAMTVLTGDFKKRLINEFGARVKFDEPMAGHTSFQVGGPADALVYPADAPELAKLVKMLKQAGIQWFVMGGGTNLLVKDRGIRGVVICLGQGFDYIKEVFSSNDGVLVEAGAGVRLSSVCRYAAEKHLSGMQFAVGIPGSVGGAVLMNAGTAIGEIGSVIQEIDVIDSAGKIMTIERGDLKFEYRFLSWDAGRETEDMSSLIVITARLQLVSARHADPEAEYQALAAGRRQTQPRGFSAGCIFKNPSVQMPAGRLIEEAGLKGLQVGGAAISEVHANFILNLRQACAADILKLMETAQEKVRQKFEVILEPEIRIVGE